VRAPGGLRQVRSAQGFLSRILMVRGIIGK
jgi:hypothetical protein